ncbi:MAG: amidohydrolase family protein [Deltaproteobacteria bacterium]|nr:amidohydrolase family protein [Deltaproteobacteria bacterium]
MPMRNDVPIIDTMIGFAAGFDEYDFIRRQLKDAESRDQFDFPVEYMFKTVPKEVYRHADPIAATLHEMDRFGIERGLVGVHDDVGKRAVKRHPDRFIALGGTDPHAIVDGIRSMRRQREEWGVRAFTAFPAGFEPQVPIDDARMYPIYAECIEMGLPIFVCAGVPGPRLPMACQHVERIDRVMFDFPELVFVTRHGCEPWTALAVALLRKWPNLHYSTSAFAPRHYPPEIIAYANADGAEKVLYAGYFPMGLSLERIMGDMERVGLEDRVWPLFLRENARRILKLD